MFPLLHETFEQSADRLPKKTALVCDGQRLTYTDLELRANRLAHGLRSLDVRRGDRVVLHLPNSVELVTGIYGTLKAGGVFVPVNSTIKPEKLAYILGNCGARSCITTARGAEALQPLRSELPELRSVIVTSGGTSDHQLPNGVGFDDLLSDSPDIRPAPGSIDLDLACLIYTSGSTGEPKGVMSDHSNVTFAVKSITSYLENRQEDIVIGVLPLSFDYGLYQLLMAFSFGGTLVLERGFTYPAEVLQRIQQEQVTGFPGVPTLFSVLLAMDLSPYDLSSLRYMTNTAAALPTSHIQQIRQKFPQARLFSMYGLTETKRCLYLPVEELDRRPGSVGIPIPGTEAWLEDEQGHRLGRGETGELVIRGRHVMRGYWGDPKASAERFHPGAIPGERVCHTGDVFRTDEDGFFYFVGRRDDIIKSRGEKVSPKEVENVLYALPGVREAAVIGVQDPVLGQAIKAFVASDDAGLTEARILRHCREHLEDFMVPRAVEVRQELPKTPSGKIKKTELH